MQAFEFYCPTKIIFGRGAEEKVGETVRTFGGMHVLLVYGGQSAVKSGLIARIERSLEEAGLAHTAFGGAQPNPRMSHAREGVKRAIECGADFILAVGGGSAIDTAKAIADGAASPETEIRDFWLGKAPLQKTLPVGVVLTLAAAGSETSVSAVLTDDETHLKPGLSSELHRPAFAIMDPELTYTLPPYQIACGVVDILMHTRERYFSPDGSENRMTDEIAEGLMRTVVAAGRKALVNSRDYDAMSEIMWAGSLSHNGLTGLGRERDFSAHALGHQLSGVFDVAHGASLSVMWPQWARYVVSADPVRFGRYGEKVWGLERAGGEDELSFALRAIGTTENFFRALSMPVTFTELGIGVLEPSALEDLADRATRSGTRKIGKLHPLGRDEVLAVYRMANQ